MKRTKIVLLLAVYLLALVALSPAEAQESTNPRVVVETSEGPIVVELFADKAPISVENFLKYVDNGFYEGTIFHRVIDDFMIQGGGFTPGLEKKSYDGEIQNEADNGLRNDRGTLAMARRNDPHTASVQFFVNLKDNDFLNHTAKKPRGWGYAVFGQVVEGMEVVDAIARTRTGVKSGMKDVPVQAITILKVSRQPAAG